MSKNIDQITRTLLELDGSERIVGRDALGDFKIIIDNLLGQIKNASGVYRSAIRNGKMAIAQHGISFPAIGNGVYSLDGWVYNKVGSMIETVAQSSNAPDKFNYSLSAEVTTADSSIAAGDYSTITQHIEGFDFSPYVGEKATLGFYVSSPKTGIHCVALRNSVADRSYIMEYTVDIANTLQFVPLPVTFDFTGGTWNYTNGIGLSVVFVKDCGSTFQTTKDIWQSGDFLATSNQVNVSDTIGNIFYVTGVQLNIGSTAFPFEHLDYGKDLARNQRYGLELNPTGGSGLSILSGGLFTSAVFLGVKHYPVAMRSTIQNISVSDAAHFIVFRNGATVTPTAITVGGGPTPTTIEIQCAVPASTAGHAAQLRTQSASARLFISAEL